jgi:hypothetical protein
MINPDCPHVVPSLDHPDGEYCPKCNGGPCQLSESEALAELVDQEWQGPHYRDIRKPGESDYDWAKRGPEKIGNCHNKGKTTQRRQR